MMSYVKNTVVISLALMLILYPLAYFMYLQMKYFMFCFYARLKILFQFILFYVTVIRKK